MWLVRWLSARLDRPGARALVVGLALLLALPSLASPIVMDEYAQLLRFRQAREPGGRSFLGSAFVFADPAERQRDFERGVGIWWVAPDLKIAFWRPLSAATQAIDFSLWPHNALLMHVHTLLWFVLLLWAIAALFQRFLPRSTANLALALYAWDDARGMVLSWIANRHALISTALGALVLVAHDKWRRDAWRTGAWLGPVLLALALLSSEMGLATTAFLLGHALFVDQGSLFTRLARLTPYVLVALAWQLTYSASGYGAVGSGAYLHPLHEPLAYAQAALTRVPLLALGQLTPLASDAWGYLPPTAAGVMLVVALVTLAAVARVLAPELANVAQARFWLFGALLALLPLAAVGPSDRNLCFVGLGVSPVLALALSRLVQQPIAAGPSGIVLGALALFNLVLAPLLLPAKCLYMLGLQGAITPTSQSVPSDTHRTLIVAATPSEGPVSVTFWQRDALHNPRPRAARILVATFGESSITRVDRFTLRFHRDAGFFEAEMHTLARGRSRPFHQGDYVELRDLQVTVTEVTPDGRPKAIEFRFQSALDSPEWRWMRGSGFQLIDWVPPDLGETVVIGVTS